jgi:hypothetical protein
MSEMYDIHDIHENDEVTVSEEQRAIDQITHILLHALTEDGIGEQLEHAKSQQDVYKLLQTLPYFKLTFEEFQLGIQALRQQLCRRGTYFRASSPSAPSRAR